MSEESTPVLSGAIPLFKLFMSQWEMLSMNHLHLQPLIKPGLELAYTYYGQMDRTSSYIIAMHT
jgi:hypothetical protein